MEELAMYFAERAYNRILNLYVRYASRALMRLYYILDFF